MKHRGQLGSCIESEHDLVRFLVAPMSELAPLAHDQETALRQHTNRRGVVARSAGVKRTSGLQLAVNASCRQTQETFPHTGLRPRPLLGSQAKSSANPRRAAHLASGDIPNTGAGD